MSQRRRTPALSRAMTAWRARRREEPEADAAGQRGEAAQEQAAEHPADEIVDLGAHFLPSEDSLGVLPWSLAEDWHLVLEACGVPHLVRRRPGGFLLLAQADHAPQAMEELSAYLHENRQLGLRPRPRARFANAWATALSLGLLLAFHSLTYARFPDTPWLPQGPWAWEKLGAVKAGNILAGEWWRLATALTLHADAGHAASNVAVGALFALPLTAAVGLGPGLLLGLASGILGNLLNALAQGPEHTSVGFSTAVFGIAGIISAMRAMEGVHVAWATPVAAGLGLLALMGAGGERTDLGAHLFGFVSGLGLGAAMGWRVNRFGPPGRLERWAAGLLAAALPVAAWAMAMVCQ